MDEYTAQQFEKIRIRTEFEDIVNHLDQETREEEREADRQTERHERAAAFNRELRSYRIAFLGMLELIVLILLACIAAQHGWYAVAIPLAALGIYLVGRAVLKADRTSKVV